MWESGCIDPRWSFPGPEEGVLPRHLLTHHNGHLSENGSILGMLHSLESQALTWLYTLPNSTRAGAVNPGCSLFNSVSQRMQSFLRDSSRVCFQVSLVFLSHFTRQSVQTKGIGQREHLFDKLEILLFKFPLYCQDLVIHS